MGHFAAGWIGGRCQPMVTWGLMALFVVSFENRTPRGSSSPMHEALQV